LLKFVVSYSETLKRLFGILLCAMLIINMIGKPVLEFYQEEVQSEVFEESVFFVENGDSLLVKTPFQLPYRSTITTLRNIDEVVIYKGEFFSAFKKTYANDTLYTFLKKENFTRQNFFQLMGEITKNYDTVPIDPVQNMIDLLKNFSKNYVKNTFSYYTFYWTDYLSVNYPDVAYIFASFRKIPVSPPPQASFC
jgi:hypothetical protein